MYFLFVNLSIHGSIANVYGGGVQKVKSDSWPDTVFPLCHGNTHDDAEIMKAQCHQKLIVREKPLLNVEGCSQVQEWPLQGGGVCVLHQSQCFIFQTPVMVPFFFLSPKRLQSPFIVEQPR